MKSATGMKDRPVLIMPQRVCGLTELLILWNPGNIFRKESKLPTRILLLLNSRQECFRFKQQYENGGIVDMQ